MYIADLPTVTGLRHDQCTGTTALTACPVIGGGTLTVTGTNFYGPTAATVAVNEGCTGTLTVNGAFTQITCSLQAHTAGYIVPNVVVSTNGGTTAANTGFSITYGMQLIRAWLHFCNASCFSITC